MLINVYLGTGNHGCSDAVDIEVASRSQVATVLEETVCTSCWQVGHDIGRKPTWEVGGKIHLPVQGRTLDRINHYMDVIGQGKLAEDIPVTAMRCLQGIKPEACRIRRDRKWHAETCGCGR